VGADPDPSMAEVSSVADSPRDWRFVALIGAISFPASFALFDYVVPLDASAAAVSEPVVAAFGAGVTTVAAMLCAGLVVAQRMQIANARMHAAINNIAQGLCVFDRSERLVFCNRRYREMYKLSEDIAQPGRTLASLLEFRVANGTFSRDPAAYRKELVAAMAQGKTTNAEVKSAGGRLVCVINRPTADGGWVATHEDITDRRDAERERASLHKQRQRRAAIEQAIAAFRQRVEEHLRTVAGGAQATRSTATALLASSGETSQRAEGAVSTSNEASANINSAAVAAEELARSIAEIGGQLSLATNIVRAAVQEAQGTNQQIAALAQATRRIGDVIKLIRAIAGQTNLLALNAAIEAARAGEAGRGFAVVASEVKSLAVQTAKSTEDISKLIGAVQGSTGGAVDAIGRIANRMQEINSYTSAVAAAVEQQSAATTEISQNVTSAADGAKLVVSVLGDVSGAAGVTRQSAESVLAASRAVEAAMAELRHEVETFLARVAA
jgi:methyl-accepting chemotaxis protein